MSRIVLRTKYRISGLCNGAIVDPVRSGFVIVKSISIFPWCDCLTLAHQILSANSRAYTVGTPKLIQGNARPNRLEAGGKRGEGQRNTGKTAARTEKKRRDQVFFILSGVYGNDRCLLFFSPSMPDDMYENTFVSSVVW